MSAYPRLMTCLVLQLIFLSRRVFSLLPHVTWQLFTLKCSLICSYNIEAGKVEPLSYTLNASSNSLNLNIKILGEETPMALGSDVPADFEKVSFFVCVSTRTFEKLKRLNDDNN